MNTNPAPAAPVIVLKSAVSDKLTQLSGLTAQVDTLRTEIETARTNELKGLHSVFGFASPEEFLTAYNAAVGISGSTSRPARKNGTKPARKASNGKKASGRKERVSITPERKAEILKFFKDGGTTMEAMSKFNIAYATAQNYKSEAGMVNHRK